LPDKIMSGIEKSPKEKEPEESLKEKTRRIFERFLKLPAEPKYSYEEQIELQKQSKESEEAFAKFKESKGDKKHTAPIYAVLGFAQIFLDSSEAEIIPDDKRSKLWIDIGSAFQGLEEATDKGAVTDELIEQTENIINKILPYLK